MKQFVLICLVMLSISPAFAEAGKVTSSTCSPIKGQNINKEFVNNFLKLAQILKTPCPSYYSESGNNVLIEYLPLGEKLENWKNMMSVNIIVTGTQDEKVLIEEVTTNFLGNIIKSGGKAEVIANTPKTNPDVVKYGQRFAIRYNVGEGSARESSVAVVRGIGSHLISVIQYQQRGGDLSDNQIDSFVQSNGWGISPKK